VNGQGHITVEAATTFNSIFESVLGTDQKEFSPQIQIGADLREQQPFLAMSSHYGDFARSGLIGVHKAKMSAFEGSTVKLADGEEIKDVAAIILATGFDAAPSLEYLPADVLEAISFSPTHPSLPAALAFHGTHHPTYPSLGFVGYYRSPYWGVMEMQARFLAQQWTTPAHPQAMRDALAGDDTMARTLALRDDARRSQFPMGDYAFLMQEFARALGMHISPPRMTPPLRNGKSMDILTPARYAPPAASEAQRAEVQRNLAATHATALAGLTAARFVAGAVFRSLLGEWRLERDLVSRLPSHPSGRFVGTAQFLLRAGTADGRGSGDDAKEEDLGMEYLYIEDGNFTASNGMTFRATRRYVYRYDEARDVLSVWFACTDDNTRADYLFHGLEFIPPPEEDDEEENRARSKGWQAKASHLCIDDLYNVQYEFNFKAVNLQRWKIGYTVRGPKKDYTIDGVYSRK
jgi:hypothetical protein